MANFNVPNLGTAVTGFDPLNPDATQVTYTVNHYIPLNSNKNISITETRPGWLTGRRPSQGQLFPRGVYNK